MAEEGHPILQFGTSRFLQAHVDLFVSQAGESGRALGGITVVQTTGNPVSTRRVRAMAQDQGFPVVLRGLVQGKPEETRLTCRSVREAFHASDDWPAIRRRVRRPVQVIVSNTGDRGWELAATDDPAMLGGRAAAPASFPAKLLVLLHDRFESRPDAAPTVLPCELVSRNGDRLRDIVVELAQAWACPAPFVDWLREHVVWGNSLVDRIVSESIEPAGAVAEPYALWAIERQDGLVLPCEHPAVLLTDDLRGFERLKLHLLNLGHTVLADLWLRGGAPAGLTVLQAMQTPSMRDTLEAVWQSEVLPVFELWDLGDAARRYLEELRDRLLNPFLEHRLADIAQNHAEKKRRRLAPMVDLAASRMPGLQQPLLRASLLPNP